MIFDTGTLLTAAQAAAFLRLHYDSLRRLKRLGIGPRFVQLSARATFYRVADLEEFRAMRLESR